MEFSSIDWVHGCHIRNVKPRPEHLESDDEFDSIENEIIKNVTSSILNGFNIVILTFH